LKGKITIEDWTEKTHKRVMNDNEKKWKSFFTFYLFGLHKRIWPCSRMLLKWNFQRWLLKLHVQSQHSSPFFWIAAIAQSNSRHFDDIFIEWDKLVSIHWGRLLKLFSLHLFGHSTEWALVQKFDLVKPTAPIEHWLPLCVFDGSRRANFL